MKHHLGLFACVLGLASYSWAMICSADTAHVLDTYYSDPDKIKEDHNSALDWLKEKVEMQRVAADKSEKSEAFKCKEQDLCFSYSNFPFCANIIIGEVYFADGSTLDLFTGVYTTATGETDNIDELIALAEASTTTNSAPASTSTNTASADTASTDIASADTASTNTASTNTASTSTAGSASIARFDWVPLTALFAGLLF